MYDELIYSVPQYNIEIYEKQFYGFYASKYFLDRFYGDELDDQIILYVDQGQRPHLFGSEFNITLVRAVTELAKIEKDIYICIGTVGYEHLDIDFDLRLQYISSVPAFWVNIKIQSLRNKNDQLPYDTDVVYYFFSLQKKPQIIVNAGDELQAYWIFDQPFIIHNDTDRDIISKMSHDFQQKIIKEGLKHGFHIEDTSSIATMQRLPGTMNWKLDRPEIITLYELERTSNNEWTYTCRNSDFYRFTNDRRAAIG